MSLGLDPGDRQVLEQKYNGCDPPCLLDSSDGRLVTSLATTISHFLYSLISIAVGEEPKSPCVMINTMAEWSIIIFSNAFRFQVCFEGSLLQPYGRAQLSIFTKRLQGKRPSLNLLSFLSYSPQKEKTKAQIFIISEMDQLYFSKQGLTRLSGARSATAEDSAQHP